MTRPTYWPLPSASVTGRRHAFMADSQRETDLLPFINSYHPRFAILSGRGTIGSQLQLPPSCSESWILRYGLRCLYETRLIGLRDQLRPVAHSIVRNSSPSARPKSAWPRSSSFDQVRPPSHDFARREFQTDPTASPRCPRSASRFLASQAPAPRHSCSNCPPSSSQRKTKTQLQAPPFPTPLSVSQDIVCREICNQRYPDSDDQGSLKTVA